MRFIRDTNAPNVGMQLIMLPNNSNKMEKISFFYKILYSDIKE